MMYAYPLILALLNRFVRGQGYSNPILNFATVWWLWGVYAGAAYYGLSIATGHPDLTRSIIIAAGLTIWAIHNMGLILISRREEELNGYRTWFFTPFGNISVLGNALIYTIARHWLLLAPLCVSLGYYDGNAAVWALKWLAGALGITAIYFTAGIKETPKSAGYAELATGALLGVGMI